MGNIAIDGPAGAGKSTIAKLVAKRLGCLYVDTGALYRAVALFVFESNADPKDENAVAELLNQASIKLGLVDGAQAVYVNDEDVTARLRSEAAGNAASIVSAYPAVREKLLSVQRQTAKAQSVVMDGRDIGTVVLPGAKLKVYLTASPEVRAKRRFDELVQKGQTPDFGKIKQDIIKRDEQDMTRTVAPLKKAEDAVELDSSQLSIDEVVALIIGEYEKRSGK